MAVSRYANRTVQAISYWNRFGGQKIEKIMEINLVCVEQVFSGFISLEFVHYKNNPGSLNLNCNAIAAPTAWNN